jgi:Cu(I)/Ag(I) efflux system membrane fusion protein
LVESIDGIFKNSINSKKMKKLFANKYIRYSLFILVGLIIGRLVFHTSRNKSEDTKTPSSETAKTTIWTCSMHPQIRMNKPGKCPICGMDLIPLDQASVAVDSNSIHLSKDALELANVLTSVVSRQKPVKEIRLYGKVQAEENLIQSQVAHISGRIEKLMVSFTGEEVIKGQTLAQVYSPELITAQQELIETVKMKKTEPAYYEAAKEKLRLWKLSDAQIADIENSGVVQNYFNIISDTKGTVTLKRVNTGDHVSEGTVLFDIADLSQVWVMFDAYESDLMFLNKGDKITFTMQAMPGKTFTGSIAFIDPVIDPVTRVAKVRVEVNNATGNLKPEMFATGIVKANLADYANSIIIPRTAVLWTGKRSIVYIKKLVNDESVFTLREIELGPMLGNSYVVTSGLVEGEEIVTQGAFSVDAAAQLEGKPSMMNAKGVKKDSTSMPGMKM